MATENNSNKPRPVVKVENVRKEFIIRRTHTLKETLVWSMTGRRSEISERFRALDDVSFTVNEGDTVALLGYNGSGKSTCLKLISGVLREDSGYVGVRGKVAGLIEVGAGFHPDLTGRENVYLNGAILGMSKKEVEDAFDEIVAFSEIEKFIDTEVKFYSSGMFLRLAFSVAVHTDPDIFLVDEILAVGDEPFQRKCLARVQEMKAAGTTLVIVSHDLDMIADICDRGILLEKGRIVVDGTVDEAIERMRSEQK
ncbi:MAG: ABC transporter ATP-binding protein [Actinomyces sp.]|uniref:ABC transporter ATP-binding protein n=1 Tax=Actinomyces sp. TaxID=29317 RepID=UPI001EB129BE|nr:ABC transporter ATP-binding protein [Actinomyces sp.]MBS5825889.1 ABC transporter ATP-binding protein [Actinomyces sp.]MDU4286169.1 ABC transporter ATP-binding protein [Actinomyces sp.]